MENKEVKLSKQLPTFIGECILFALCVIFAVLMVYNYIPGRNYYTNQVLFEIEGTATNFIVLVISCSVVIVAGLGLVAVAIVGKYKDKILLPHHISFISGIVAMTAGIVFLSLLLFVAI